MELKERLDLAAKLLVTEDEQALACAKKALEGQRFAEQDLTVRYELFFALLRQAVSVENYLLLAVQALREFRQQIEKPILPELIAEVPEEDEPWSEEEFQDYLRIIKENRERPAKEYDF